jgi:isopentenyl-diphosphate delta-isomerase
MSPAVAARLWQAGVRYLDVAGAGGTSWPKVERHRKGDHLTAAIAWVFGDWGIPTAAAVIGARRACGDGPCIIGSGGLWTGLDAARVLACGADLAGYAQAALRAPWGGGGREADRYFKDRIHELKAAMLLTGCADLAALRQAPRVYTGALRDWMDGGDWQQP